MTGLARKDRRTRRSQDGARQDLDRSFVIGNPGRSARRSDLAQAGAAKSLPSRTGISQLRTRRRSPRLFPSTPASHRSARCERCAASIPIRGAERQPVIGPGVRDESMLHRAVEGLCFSHRDSTFRMLLPPGSESPSGGLTFACIAEQGTSGSPARSQPGRLRRFSSEPFRRDSRAPLPSKSHPAYPEDRT